MASGDKEQLPRMLHNVQFLDDDEEDDIDDLGGEEEILHFCSTADGAFDTAIGHIEDIIVEDDFQELQDKFLEENYEEFDDTDENKFCYTEIHRKYIDTLEKFIDEELRSRMPEYDMEEFSKILTEKRGELDGEIFDMLYTFTDFIAFKDMMVDYKKARMGQIDDLSLGITIVPLTPRGVAGSQGNGDITMHSVEASFDLGLNISGSQVAPAPSPPPAPSDHLQEQPR